VLSQNSTVRCTASSYVPGEVAGHFAVVDIEYTNPKNGALDQYEIYVTSYGDSAQQDYSCNFYHWKYNKKGLGREVRRDQQDIPWDEGEDHVAKFNGCLDELDILHQSLETSGAQELGVTLAANPPDDTEWTFINSCDPNDGVEGDNYDGSPEAFVPGDEYLQ
jgi:hypothetical protein